MPETSIGMAPQGQAERAKFEQELQRIVAAGDAAHLTLRVLGALAFRTHCPQFGYLQEKMGRSYTDIDFAAYARDSKGIRALMAGLGYAEDKEVFVVSEGSRAIFENPQSHIHVDVFYEKLDFCHVIPWNGRLEIDSPTIPLAEMLLEKTQIVQINEKDVIDMIMLFLEHGLGEDDREIINIKRIARLCAEDWGLWRTVSMNLEKIDKLAQNYDTLNSEHKARVSSQVGEALRLMEAEPKSMAWRLRARVGDRVKWYKDVDEVK
ncbi:MAG TPA: hypothetical protein VJJ70_02710 [Anaerolineales bacterium]|nr:hypothetical protein [Anaerolineales bacterium]